MRRTLGVPEAPEAGPTLAVGTVLQVEDDHQRLVAERQVPLVRGFHQAAPELQVYITYLDRDQ